MATYYAHTCSLAVLALVPISALLSLLHISVLRTLLSLLTLLCRMIGDGRWDEGVRAEAGKSSKATDMTLAPTPISTLP